MPKKDKDASLPCYKIIMLGDSNVGKTSIMTRLIDDNFLNHHVTTLGMQQSQKLFKVSGAEVKLLIWDTAGQERFHTMTDMYYRKTQGILLIYDCTDLFTFNNIQNWLKQIREKKELSAVVIFLIANKIDLDDERKVSIEDGQKLSRENDLQYFECSAFDGTNVKSFF